jgi:hypothetical protein
MTVQRFAIVDNPLSLACSDSLRTRFSISSIFFINGFVIASWLPHIPEVKERLALGDFQLGMALFSMAAGSVAALPFAGWLAGRFGSDRAIRMAGLLLCVLLTAPVAAPSLPLLMLALLLFGAANGMLDVAMNAQAVEIENRYSRPILSSLHGLYSAGGPRRRGVGGAGGARRHLARSPSGRHDWHCRADVVMDDALTDEGRNSQHCAGRRAGMAVPFIAGGSALWRSSL